jgi:hypothetical protein
MRSSEELLARADRLLDETEKYKHRGEDALVALALADSYVTLAAEVAKHEMRQRMIRHEESRSDRQER